MQQLQVRAIRAQEQDMLLQFLAKQGLQRDARLDYSAGIFDGSRLLATGSLSGNTLRCLAVDPAYVGENLMSQIVAHLTRIQVERGYYHLFLYTKPKYVSIFHDLGYTEIVRDGDRAVFMENRKTGFADYLRRLRSEGAECQGDAERIGAIVMHANPFTLGHRYLAEQAVRQCEKLHVFVLSEDVSAFPAKDRIALVQAGLTDLSGVIVHETDNYLISGATFPAYFLADDREVCLVQAGMDAQIFARIAKALGITMRFMGEEPYSQVTALYNQVTKDYLTQQGIAVHIVPRIKSGGEVISASAVRHALARQEFSLVRRMVPDVTWDYLCSEKGEAVVRHLAETEADITKR